MPIEDRNLKPGTQLVARYHKQSYSCQVVEGEGSKLRYRLEDGREFKSPSAAGMAITGHACDGWVFWSVETATTATAATAPQPTENSPAETRQTTETTEATSSDDRQPDEAPVLATVPTPRAEKIFFRTPNQKGVSEGQTRWYCHDCGKSFLAASGQTPRACPQGHQAG